MAAFISSGAGHGRAHGGCPAAWAPRAGPRGIRIVRVGSLPSGYVKLCDIPRRCLSCVGPAPRLLRFGSLGTKGFMGFREFDARRGGFGKSGGGRKERCGAEPHAARCLERTVLNRHLPAAVPIASRRMPPRRRARPNNGTSQMPTGTSLSACMVKMVSFSLAPSVRRKALVRVSWRSRIILGSIETQTPPSQGVYRRN